jgi:hypothetical protein
VNRLTSLAVIALLLTHAASAGGQQPARDTSKSEAGRGVLRGVVRDPGGGSLEGAEVRLDSSSFALTDAAGGFTLPIAGKTDLRLRVRRLGYLAKDTVIPASVVLDRTPLAIVLTPGAVQLGTIIVEGRALDTRLWDAGYYHRQRLGAGRFVGPEELAHFASGLASIVRETPRVQMDREHNQDFAYSRMGGHRCRMNVFVDGTYARYASPGTSGARGGGDPGVGLNDVVPLEDIRAVEIYPSFASVPAQFVRIGPAPNQSSQGRGGRLGALTAGTPSTIQQDEGPSDAVCGAIVIWTKWYASNRQPKDRAP